MRRRHSDAIERLAQIGNLKSLQLYLVYIISFDDRVLSATLTAKDTP